MSAKRVTISDIARESGASRTTVSLVLRDRPGIGGDTRDRVLAAAQALGYARRLPGVKREVADVRAVAILFRSRPQSPEDRSQAVNPFYSWVLTGMEATARARRMNLLYGTLGVDAANQVVDVPDHLLDQPLDGAIVVGTFVEDTVRALLGGRSYPVVQVDGPAQPQAFDVIASDNVGGAKAAVEHLIGHGHRTIGLITRYRDVTPNFNEREDGYLAAMAEAGCQPVVGRISEEDAADALAQVLDQEPDTTALFCVNDRFAIDSFKAATARGISVPGDLSIVGFDNTDHATSMQPGLTTMSVDKVGMGRHAILTLDYRLNWPDAAPGCLILSPKLLVRGSVAPPRTATTAGIVSSTRTA
jgi:LacI family transcriptional regulator